MRQIIFLAILFGSQCAYAQTGETELYAAYDKVDKKLKIKYRKLQTKLKGKDKAALIASQAAWIKYRDSDCKFKSKIESEGGVISNKMYFDCLRVKTYQRIKELEETAADF